jgi:hypothetical protein
MHIRLSTEALLPSLEIGPFRGVIESQSQVKLEETIIIHQLRSVGSFDHKMGTVCMNIKQAKQQQQQQQRQQSTEPCNKIQRSSPTPSEEEEEERRRHALMMAKQKERMKFSTTYTNSRNKYHCQ